MKYWRIDTTKSKSYLRLKPNVVRLLRTSPLKESIRLAVEALKEKYAKERAEIVLDCPLCIATKDCEKCPWAYIVNSHGEDTACMQYLADKDLLDTNVTQKQIDDFWKRYKIWKKYL